MTTEKLQQLVAFGLIATVTTVFAQEKAPVTTLVSRVPYECGIPLGGVGTGSVEIRPDGTLQDWQIFNMGPWAPEQPKELPGKEPKMKMEFYLRTQTDGGQPAVRRLSVSPRGQELLYDISWLKNVKEISFAGQYPLARLNYSDDELPVVVQSTWWSPFIPHESRTSGTPGFYGVFKIKNTAAKNVRISLVGTMKNPLACGAADRKLTTTVTSSGDAAVLTMRTAAEQKAEQTFGSLSLSVSGGEPCWIADEFSSYLDPEESSCCGGRYGYVYENFLREFRMSGTLPSLPPAGSPEQFLRMSDKEMNSEEPAECALTPAARKEWMTKLRGYAWFDSLAKRVLEVDAKAFDSDEGVGRFIKECAIRLDRACGKDRANHRPWGAGALGSSVTLKPGEEKEITFTLGWYFPNHYSAMGPRMGHMYENWFKDAEEVNAYLTKNRKKLVAQTTTFADALYTTSLGTDMADAWSSQLSTLVKCSWWTKDGDFGIWEGLGCCGLHTTDITYQGSFNILALFPDLQKRQMTVGARFQREDGRVHHSFPVDFKRVDDGFDRVDMNPQFILLACRDYLWTGDKEYLKTLWPHIVRAMKNSGELDADGDGLPDHNTGRNTYDLWDFRGTPSYISSLWLGALKAGIRLADDLGEKEAAQEWRALLDKGTTSFMHKLWNGEYFSLWVDKEQRDECCMTDQMSGEWFAQLVGIGHALPKDKIVAALHVIYRTNFTRENGLINAAYPAGKQPRFSTYRNRQAMATWTGIEYAIASMMMEYGMAPQAREIVSAVQDRYLRAGQPWSHVECGVHYYRAMASWAVLLSASGFKVDVPQAKLTFMPDLTDGPVSAPWFSSTGWGGFVIQKNACSLTLAAGQVSFKTLALSLEPGKCSVKVNGKSVAASMTKTDGGMLVAFDNEITLKEGDSLSINQPGDFSGAAGDTR